MIAKLKEESRVIQAPNDDELLQISTEIGELENQLDAVESHHLSQRAKRFGIDLKEAVGPWNSNGRGREWLEDKYQIKAAQVISDARYAWWKKWVDLLSPVLSVIMSLLAVAIAGFALYLQVTGKSQDVPPLP